MIATLSSYALVGIEAAQVEIVVDGDRAKGVEPSTDRCLHSIKLRTTEPADSVLKQVVNARTLAPGRSAPADRRMPAVSTDRSGVAPGEWTGLLLQAGHARHRG